MDRPAPIAPLRVLVAADAAVGALLRRQLAARGFLATAAASAEAVRQAARPGLFDLALLDMHVPGLAAVEAISCLARSNPRAPVLLMTGAPDADLIGRCRALGAHGPLLKPFLAAELFDWIDRLAASPPAPEANAAPAAAADLLESRTVKRLYLMRHGHAPTPAEAGVRSDALRPLSEKGRHDARRMAAELARLGARPSLILHSPLLRAAQTAQAAALEIKPASGVEPFSALDNTRAAEEVVEALKARAEESDEVLAVGHQPQLGEIAALLTRSLYDIRPSGLVAIEVEPGPRPLWSLNVDELG